MQGAEWQLSNHTLKCFLAQPIVHVNTIKTGNYNYYLGAKLHKKKVPARFLEVLINRGRITTHTVGIKNTDIFVQK